MSEVITVLLPEGTNPQIAEGISGEIRGLEGVVNAGTTADRALDVAALAVWLTFSGDAMGLANTAFELVQRIVGVIRGRGIQGVTIELPNGAKIAVDHASAADIQKLVDALKDEDSD